MPQGQKLDTKISCREQTPFPVKFEIVRTDVFNLNFTKTHCYLFLLHVCHNTHTNSNIYNKVNMNLIILETLHFTLDC